MKLLMCEPKYYGVEYEINPHMIGNMGKVDHSKAQKQWEKLYESLSKVVKIDLIEPIEGCPDMVFTANAGFVKGNTVFLSNLSKKERKPEEHYFREWFAHNDYDIIQPKHIFEGEGDLLKDDLGFYWLGFGQRTSGMTLGTLIQHDFSFVSTYSLQMIDPRFYHLDTCLCPLKGRDVLWYPDAFGTYVRNILAPSYFGFHPIDISEKEALTFAANAIILNEDKVFMPKCESVAKRLEGIGYSVSQFEMSEFLKSGGAVKCLVLKMED